MIYFIGKKGLYEDEQTIAYRDMEYLVDWLEDKEVVTIDIETTGKFNKYANEGLDPYTSKIIMLQMGNVKDQFVIDTRYINPMPALIQLEGMLVIGHNISFECKHIYHNYGIEFKEIYDTMIAEQVLYNGFNKKYGLKDLALKYTGAEMSKDTRMEFLHIGSSPFLTHHILYGAKDVEVPHIIWNKQQERTTKYNLQNCINLEMEFTQVIWRVEYKGMYFDKQQWESTYTSNSAEYFKKEEELEQYIVVNWPMSKFVDKQLDLFSDRRSTTIKWTSSKQVVELFNYLEACPMEVSASTGKEAFTVNAKVLQSSLNTINKDKPQKVKELITRYIKYKELEQACTTFGLDFFKHINPITGRVHSNYRQIISTGRMSSSAPNLQNIPADVRFRKAFTAPSGYKVVNADFSGQEQIVLANKCLDKDLLAFYDQGLGDMHSFIASKIFPELKNVPLGKIKSEYKDKRQIAKSAGFALNYGGTGFTIAKNLGISQEEGTKVEKAYYKAFPGLIDYYNKVAKHAFKYGYILINDTTHRKFWFIREPNGDNKVKRLAQNYPIQGTSGDITKLASIYFYKRLKERGLEKVAYITNIIHDEINVEVEVEYATQVATLLEEQMKKAGSIWCKRVPLEATAAITDHWSH